MKVNHCYVLEHVKHKDIEHAEHKVYGETGRRFISLWLIILSCSHGFPDHRWRSQYFDYLRGRSHRFLK